MNANTILKSVLLVGIVYISFILNNSLNSVFTSDLLVFSLIACFILTELLVSTYKLVFSHAPGLLFYSSSLVLVFIFSLTNNIIVQNLMVLFGLFVFSNVSVFLNNFSSYEDQLQPQSFSFTKDSTNITLNIQKGLVFNEYIIIYTTNLSFISLSDKRNIFDMVMNNNGSFKFNNSPEITFINKKTSLRFSNHGIDDIIKPITDIDTILHNLITD